LLNKTAVLVWKQCDGQTTIAGMRAHLARELDVTVDESLVWYTLDQLSKKGLLEEPVRAPLPFRNMKRRDFLKAGLVGSAVLLPAIVSLTAPSPALAQSGCIPSGSPCDINNPAACCSLCCISTVGGGPPYVCCGS
jgi:hypothetical protein